MIILFVQRIVDFSKSSNAAQTCRDQSEVSSVHKMALSQSHTTFSTDTWKVPLASLLISSCVIWAHWHTLKCLVHYSFFSSHWCLGVDTYRATERLLCISLIISNPLSCFPLSPPPPSLFSCGPQLSFTATPGSHKLIHNNNSQLYLSLYLTCQQLVEWLRVLLAWKVS